MISHYFKEQLFQDFKISKLSFEASVSLVLLNELEIMYILLNDENMDKLLSQNQNSKDAQNNDQNIYKMSNYNLNTLAWVCLGYNILLISLFLYRFLSFIMDSQRKGLYTIKVWSFMMRTYKFFFFIPSIFISLSCINSPAAVVNMILSIVIQFSSLLIDFDYRLNLKQEDSLWKFPTKYYHCIKSISVTFLIINNTHDMIKYQDLLFMLFSISNLIFALFNNTYFDRTIRLIELYFWQIFLIFSFTFLLSRTIDNKLTLLSIVIILLPLALRIIYLLEVKHLNLRNDYANILQKLSQKNLFSFVSNLLQHLKNLSYDDYSSNPFSLVIDEIISNHLSTCEKFPDCFCNYETKTAQDIWNNIIGEDKRKIFLLNFINSLFLRYIDETQRQKGKIQDNLFNEEVIEVKFIYINFLMNESKSKTMSLYQIHLLQQVKKLLSIRQQMYLQYLNTRVQDHFKQLSEQTDQQNLNFLIMEDKARNLKDLYESCLLDKLQILNVLNTDHIDLNSFHLLGKQLLLKKGQLERLKKEIQIKWKQNDYIKNLLPSVSRCLGLSGNMEQFHQPIQKDLSQTVIVQNLPTNSTALISFKDGNLGQIIKSTKLFAQMFGFDNPEGIDMKSLIPADIQKHHVNFIKDFLNRFGTDSTTSKSSVPFVIAQTVSGFALPLSVHFSVEYITQFNDIGIFATFKRTHASSEFFLCDDITYNIKLMTQNFYVQYLSHLIDSSNIQQIEANSIIPTLSNIINSSLDIKTPIFTVALLPNQDYLIQQNQFKFSKLSEMFTRLQVSMDHFSLYKIQIQLHKFDSIKNSKLTIIEIISMQKLSTETDLQQSYNQIKQIIFPGSSVTPKDGFQQYSKNSFPSPSGSISPINHQVISKQIISPKQRSINDLQELFPIDDKSERYESDVESINQGDLTPNCNRFSHRNMDVTQDSFTYLKMFSMQQAQTTQRKYKPSILSMNTQQDLVGYLQQPKSPSESILQLLFSKTKENEESVPNTQETQNKNIDTSQSQYKLPISTLEQSIRLTKKRSTLQPYTREIMHVKFKDSMDNQLRTKLKSEVNVNILDSQNNHHHHHHHLILDTQNNHHHHHHNILDSQNHHNTLELYNHHTISTNHHNISTNHHNTSTNHNNISINHINLTNHQEQYESKQIKSVHQQHINKKESEDVSSQSDRKQTVRKSQSKQKKEKEEFDMSSQQSGQTGIQLQIKTIRTKLNNNKLSNSLWILNVFGLMCLVLIISMSIYQFSQMIQGLISIRFDLHFVDWPASVSTVCNSIWMKINLLLINDRNVLPNLKYDWINYKQDITTSVESLIKFGSYIFVDQMESDYTIGWYFLDFTFRRNNYFIGRQEQPSTQMVQLEHRDPEYVFIQKYMSSMYSYFYRVYSTQEEQLILTDNYQEFQRQLNFLQNQISESSISVDVYTLMIVTISLTFFQVLVTFPIYMYIQRERETVLKLFSTLQKQSLERMKSSCIESIEYITQVDIKKYLSQKLTIQTQILTATTSATSHRSSALLITNATLAKKNTLLKSLESNTKKKLISSTSSIAKFHIFLPIFGLFFFVLIIIQPITNALMVETFKEECRTIFLGLDSIFSMKDSLTKAISFSYGNIYSKLTQNVQSNNLFDQTFFERQIPSVFVEGNKKLNYLNQIISKIEQESNHSDKEYLYIISQIMQNNICEVFEKYPALQVINERNVFNYQECLTSRDGVFTKGFQVASQYFLSEMSNLFEISSIQDDNVRQMQLLNWEKDFNVYSFNKFYDSISNVVSVVQNLLLDRGFNRINQMWSIQIILAIFQILNLMFIFFIGWLNFFKKIRKQLQNSRLIITLFDPDQIIDNPYIMSYINKIK